MSHQHVERKIGDVRWPQGRAPGQADARPHTPPCGVEGAWALACGEWPKGSVKTKNGADDFRLENLVVVSHCAHKPHTKGGRASSLIRRHDADRALLAALADNPHPTIAGLSRLIGCSEARTSTHLGKLAERGLTASPMCVPGRSWALTGEGLAVAMDERPLVDDLDCDVLKVIAQSPSKLTKIVAQVGVCKLTARRRVDLLIERGLVSHDAGNFFTITVAGVAVVGVNTPKAEPWVRREAVAASSAKDVLQRLTHPNDNRSAAQRSAHATMAAAKAVATQHWRKMERRRFAFGDLADLDRMAG